MTVFVVQKPDKKKNILSATEYGELDFILSEKGPCVVEINPRLTTSYIGLNEALGETPATYILNAFNNNKFHRPNIKKSVKINLPL